MAVCAPSVAVLMCHAPIVIPAIGRSRSGQCLASTLAMAEAAGTVVKHGVRTLVLISPHTPRHPHAFGGIFSPTLRGSFASFGFPELVCAFPQDPEVLDTLMRHAKRHQLELAPMEVDGVDHGALVPLWFLQEAGYKGSVTILGLPWEGDSENHTCFGAVLAEALGKLGPWALVASGDMSHALRPGGPAGFDPRAWEFDEAVVSCVRENRLRDLSNIDPPLRDRAAEDVVDSLEVARGAMSDDSSGHRFLSYEGPFGVGYLVAVLRETGL
jgi:MEMO1 family protein